MKKPGFNSNERKGSFFRDRTEEMFPPRKQLLIFATGWLGFQVIASIFSLIFKSIAVSTGASTSGFNMVVHSFAYLGLFAILLLISSFDLKKLLKSFTDYKAYLAGILCWGAIFGFNLLYSLLIAGLKVPLEENANQSAINTISYAYPFASIMIFGIIAPVCEELTYRVGLFSFFRRRSRLFGYVVGALIFAFVHFNFDITSTASLINELLNLPFYLFAGFAFAFTFDHFGFAGSLTAHMVNNILSLTVFALLI